MFRRIYSVFLVLLLFLLCVATFELTAGLDNLWEQYCHNLFSSIVFVASLIVLYTGVIITMGAIFLHAQRYLALKMRRRDERKNH